MMPVWGAGRCKAPGFGLTLVLVVLTIVGTNAVARGESGADYLEAAEAQREAGHPRISRG